MKFQKYFLKFKGFTVLETSIVLAISSIFIAIGIFSPDILANLRLQSDLAGVFQTIKKAQSLALAPRPHSENICGFGVKISHPKNYSLIKKSTTSNSDPCSEKEKIIVEYKLKLDNSFLTSSLIFYKSPYLETEFSTDTIIIFNKNGLQKKIKIGNFGALVVE